MRSEARTAAARGGGPLEPGSVIDRYVVLYGFEGAGEGTGAVAYDPDLDRKVALELLAGPASGSPPEELLAGAQALARLEHPNVARVFDVGEVQGRFYVAMEHVAGRELGEWLTRERPGWRRILAVFRAAGRGLAAGHGAGLAHGDFHAGNLLITPRGEAKVLRFGLAGEKVRATAATAEGHAPSPAGSGVVPEDGARSDLYGFSLALCAALFPQLAPEPAPGLTVRPDGEALRRSPSSAAPAWVRRAVLRGLSSDPREGFESVEAMLRALSPRPRAVRRSALLAGSLALAAGALLLPGLRVGWNPLARTGDPCAGAEQKLAGLWDRQVKEAIGASRLATGSAGAREGYRRLEGALDAYTAEWVALREETCRALQAPAESSQRVLDLRMLCLDHALAATGGLVEGLRRADPGAMAAVPDLTRGLPSLSSCADPRELARIGPKAPSASAREAMVRASAALSALRAGQAMGRKLGSEEIESTLSALRSVEFLPYRASLLLQLATVRVELGEPEAAEDDLLESLRAALSAGNRREAARAYAGLAEVVGVHQGRWEEGRRWADLARAAVAGLAPEQSGHGAEILESLRRFFAAGGEEEADTRSRRALGGAGRAFADGGGDTADAAGDLETL